MKKKTSLLVCYQELSGYFLTCIEELSNSHQISIHIVSQVVNKEAPFKIDSSNPNIHYYNEMDYDYIKLKKLFIEISPSLLFVGGWGNKKYLKLASFSKNKTSTLLGFDNNWENSLKQRLLITFGKLYIKPKFDFAFVPGQQQKVFAEKLGFKKNEIFLGAYSANTPYFNHIYEENKNKPHKNYFIYVGRYVKHKGIFDMWNAFIELQNENPFDWELICIGTGEEFENRITHKKIKHLGFVQPKKLEAYLKPNGVYILPSHFEPWGVSVHEMVAAGFPIILSDKVGARELFLSNEKNGFEIEATNIESIKKAMKNFVYMTSLTREKMKNESYRLSQKISPSKWANTLAIIIHQRNS